MLRSDAEAIWSWMTQLWPDWKPNDTEAGWWLKQLQSYPDDRLIRKAVDKLKADTIYRKPSMRGLNTQVSILSPPKPVDGEARKNLTTVFIQCTEHDQPGKLGWFVPVIYPAGRTPPPHIVKQKAEEMAGAHARTYGGTWVVVEQATDEEMVASRARFQESTGKKEYAKPYKVLAETNGHTWQKEKA